MKNRDNIVWAGIVFVTIFSAISRGGMRLWAQTIIESVVFLILFMWLFVRIKKEKEKNIFTKTKIDVPLLLFVLLAVISLFFSIYTYASIQSLLRLMVYCSIFYLVVNNFKERFIRVYIYTIVITGTVLSLFGLGQYFIGLDHSWWVPNMFLASTFVNHNHFAGLLEMAIPLAVGHFFAEVFRERSQLHGLWIKILVLLSILTMIAAFILSQSRGAWISLGVSFIFTLVFLMRQKVIHRNVVIAFFSVALLGAVFIYAGHDNTSVRLSSLENIENDASFLTRVEIWKGSLTLIKHNPLIGTGIGTFVWTFPQYRSEGLNVKAHYAHNDYLHMIAEMGILVLPLMIWMIFVLINSGLKVCSKKGNSKKASDIKYMEYIILGCTVGVLSLSIHGLVDFNFHIVSNMIVFSVLAGIIMGYCAKDFSP